MKPRKVDKPLVLYGDGRLGSLAKEIIDELPIDPILVPDGLPIQHIFPINYKDTGTWNQSQKDMFLVVVCVASQPYNPIYQHLKDDGWNDIVPFWDIIEAYPEIEIHNGWFVGELTEEDTNNMGSVMSRWDDAESNEHYWAFFAWHKGRDETNLKIEPREPLPSTLADLRNRQYITLYSGTFKDLSIHAEGYELKTLKKNIKVIRENRPRIDVACYHSRDGLWKIEKYLMDNLLNYKWTFRLHAHQGQAAYIYGEPR